MNQEMLASRSSDSPERKMPEKGTPKRDGQKSLRILIVEDEFFIALDAQEKVESLGHIVVGVAISAAQSLELCQRELPDLVLMDIRLIGEPDGISAAEMIFNQHGVRSLFVTANTEPGTLQRAEAVRPLGILHKPLNLRQLKEKLETL